MPGSWWGRPWPLCWRPLWAVGDTLYYKKGQFAEKAPAGGDRPRRRGLVPCLLFLSKPLEAF